MKRFLLKREQYFIYVLFFFSPLLFAEGLFFSDPQIEKELLNARAYFARSAEAGVPQFLPNLRGTEHFFTAFSLSKPNLSFEMAYLLELPDRESTAFSKDLLWTVLHDLSSLVGLEYYSETKKKLRPLYLQADFLSRKPLDLSPIDGSFGRAEEALVLQKDSSFGVQNYTYTWAEGEGYVACTIVNETMLSYAFISAIPPKGLRTTVYALPYGKDIVLYIFTEVATQNQFPKFLEKRILTSLVNRAEVLKTWFMLHFK